MSGDMVRGVSRPRGEIPDPELRELRQARKGLGRSEERFASAVRGAIAAGGSYSVVAAAAGVARSTVQKIVSAK